MVSAFRFHSVLTQIPAVELMILHVNWGDVGPPLGLRMLKRAFVRRHCLLVSFRVGRAVGWQHCSAAHHNWRNAIPPELLQQRAWPGRMAAKTAGGGAGRPGSDLHL